MSFTIKITAEVQEHASTEVLAKAVQDVATRFEEAKISRIGAVIELPKEIHVRSEWTAEHRDES